MQYQPFNQKLWDKISKEMDEKYENRKKIDNTNIPSDLPNINNNYDKIKKNINNISQTKKKSKSFNKSNEISEIEKIDNLQNNLSKLDINNEFSDILIKDYPQFFNEITILKNINDINNEKQSNNIENIYANLSKTNIDINNLITLYEIFDQYEDYYPEIDNKDTHKDKIENKETTYNTNKEKNLKNLNINKGN